MRRIQRVSKIVKLLAYALAGVGAISWLGIVLMLLIKPLDSTALIVVLVHGLVVGAIMTVVFYRLAKLAELYEGGELFSIANVRHLRAIGWLVLLTTVGIRLGYDEALAHAVSEVEIHPGSMVAGLVFIFISWVMNEARTLDQEHGLTI